MHTPIIVNFSGFFSRQTSTNCLKKCWPRSLTYHWNIGATKIIQYHSDSIFLFFYKINDDVSNHLHPSLNTNTIAANAFKSILSNHDDVIKWKYFPRYWPFVRGIHRSPVNSPHKGQWRGALMFSLICAWMNDWVNNRETGDSRRNRTHYDVTVMDSVIFMLDYRDWWHI